MQTIPKALFISGVTVSSLFGLTGEAISRPIYENPVVEVQQQTEGVSSGSILSQSSSRVIIKHHGDYYEEYSQLEHESYVVFPDCWPCRVEYVQQRTQNINRDDIPVRYCLTADIIIDVKNR